MLHVKVVNPTLSPLRHLRTKSERLQTIYLLHLGRHSHLCSREVIAVSLCSHIAFHTEFSCQLPVPVGFLCRFQNPRGRKVSEMLEDNA